MRRGEIGIVAMAFIAIGAWGMSQWRSYTAERQATRLIEHDYPYPASLVSSIALPASAWPIELQELGAGRLYRPITEVTFEKATLRDPVFEYLADLPYLRHLRFQRCEFDVTGFLRRGSHTRLRELWFWRTPITTEQLRSVGRLSDLDYLAVDGSALKGEWTVELSGLRRLTHLHINNADFSGGKLQPLGGLSQLKSLQLSGAKHGAPWSPLRRLRNLEVLFVEDVSFDDEAAGHIASLGRLRLLAISRTGVTDRGIAQFVGLEKLERLFLTRAAITDRGVQQLAKMSHLKSLDLAGTRVTNGCLASLAAIPSLTVRVADTAIDPSRPGFFGVFQDGFWFPDEASAAAFKNAHPADNADDDSVSP